MRQGDPVQGVHCPDCCEETVVYSGNYFCTDERCNWEMDPDHPHSSLIRRYLWQRIREAKASGRTEEVERMYFYLSRET